jgi:hypothetical protein
LVHQDAVNPDGSDKLPRQQGTPYSDGIAETIAPSDKGVKSYTV